MTTETHRKDAKFQALFAVYLITLASGYIAGITFIPVPEANQNIVNTVLGFLLGTLVGTLVNYFYGTSKVQSTEPTPSGTSISSTVSTKTESTTPKEPNV